MGWGLFGVLIAGLIATSWLADHGVATSVGEPDFETVPMLVAAEPLEEGDRLAPSRLTVEEAHADLIAFAHVEPGVLPVVDCYVVLEDVEAAQPLEARQLQAVAGCKGKEQR